MILFHIWLPVFCFFFCIKRVVLDIVVIDNVSVKRG